MSHKRRIIALVDMDCFYCQVEEKLNPSIQGKPMAVVQYNLWREGGIIAANYLAKEKGVTKGMWMHEAKDLCPKIVFARVAELRGRADLTRYREAGEEVAGVLSSFTTVLERASVDEAYLDLTEAVEAELSKGISCIPLENLQTTHIIGCETSEFIANITTNQDTDGFCENDLRLAIGGIIVEKIRAVVYEKTGYKCSAGIAHNKILAKLVCGIHKPNKQTILPQSAISQYFSGLPLKKIKRLGGQFGRRIAEELNIQYVAELLKFSENELVKRFNVSGRWLYNIARGIDNESVCSKLIAKSISCCKRFPGKNAIFKKKDVEHWLNELSLEIAERLEKDEKENNRTARTITISFTREVNENDVTNSKSYALKSYDSKQICRDALEIVKRVCCKSDGSCHIKYLGMSISNFGDVSKTVDIKYFLRKRTALNVNKKTQEITDTGEFLSNSKSTSDDQNNSLHAKNYIKKKIIENNSENIKLSCNQVDVDIAPNSETEGLSSSVVDESLEVLYEPDHEFKKSSDIPNLSYLNESRINIESEHKNSFFSKYFETSNTAEEMTSNDNIKHCLEASTSTIITRKECTDIMSEVNIEVDFLDLDDKERFQKCQECGKNILITEITSHVDYHYAMKLYKEDAMHRPSDRIIENESNRMNKKRKAKEASRAFMKVFLKKSQSRLTEYTDICNK